MYAAVAIGFTVPEIAIDEAIGLLTLNAALESGSLQRTVDIAFKTVDGTSGSIATSGIR